MWCVEFWDGVPGERGSGWNEYAGTRREHKAACVDLARAMNVKLNPQRKDGGFFGHRFRVRRVRMATK